jgi:hypothetical protein
LVPDWYPIGTRLVPDWYPIGYPYGRIAMALRWQQDRVEMVFIIAASCGYRQFGGG